MTDRELDELTSHARDDGQRLYATANVLHKVGLVAVAIVGLVGLILGLMLIGEGGKQLVAGLLVIAVTAIVCWLLHLFVALSTFAARVLVHSLFSSLGTCEYLYARGFPQADKTRGTQ